MEQTQTVDQPVVKEQSMQDILGETTWSELLNTTEEPTETGNQTGATNDQNNTDGAKPAEQKTETPTGDQKPAEQSDVAKINIKKNEPAQQQTQQAQPQPTISWKDTIKGVKREEILKELGLDDFDIQFSDYRKSGNDPLKYLEAKAIDYSKVSDLDLVRDQIKRENDYMNPEDLALLTQMELRKFGLDPDASEDEKRTGKVLLQKEGYKIRQARIAEQAKFQIPAVQAVDKKPENSVDQQQAYAKAWLEHPTTKSLFQSKRVVADGGEDGYKFNFEVDDPQSLVDFWTDPKVHASYMSNEKGEPDLDTHNLMALIAMDKKAVIKALINYGMSLKQKNIVTESQNIERKTGPVPAVTTQTETEALQNAKEIKLGSIMQ